MSGAPSPSGGAGADAHAELPEDPDAPASRPLHLQPVLALWVLLGGLGGTASRLGVSAVVPRTDGLPVATVVVNLAGAFVLGVVLEALARRGPDAGRRQVARLVLGTGFCGAFTTYSSLAVDAVSLFSGGRAAAGVVYLVVSVVVGVLAAAAGVVVASAHHRRRVGDPVPGDQAGQAGQPGQPGQPGQVTR